MTMAGKRQGQWWRQRSNRCAVMEEKQLGNKIMEVGGGIWAGMC
jgi:hypothetical protein